MFLARSQFTGPPCQDIRSANCRRASANCCGSPMGPSGPMPPNGPAGPPGPPAAGDVRIVAGATARAEAEGRLAHLPGLSGRMERSTLAKLSQERSPVSNRVAQVRPERSPGGESAAPAAGSARSARPPVRLTARPPEATRSGLRQQCRTRPLCSSRGQKRPARPACLCSAAAGRRRDGRGARPRPGADLQAGGVPAGRPGRRHRRQPR